MAPSSIPSRTISSSHPIPRSSLLGVGGLPHDGQSNRRMGHQREDVDADFSLNVVQIVAKGLPLPILVVDVFVEDAPQVLNENLAGFGFGGTGEQEAPQSPITMLVTP